MDTTYKANPNKWVFDRLPLNDWQKRDLICGLMAPPDETANIVIPAAPPLQKRFKRTRDATTKAEEEEEKMAIDDIIDMN